MLEISPVLAGTFDAPQYAAPNNYAAGRTDDAAATTTIDSRRYTQFDRTATEAGSTTDFSFSDLLDLVNPLQHIPVVSSVYREITGESIHPVARIVGDILYGGLLGGATAALSGASAIGDSVMEASTGKDATGVVVAALFGPGDKKSTDGTGETQLASATATAAPAATDTPASQKTAAPDVLASAAPLPAPPSPMLPQPFAQLANAMPANAVPANADAQTKALLAAKAFPLNPNKLPFGGVMDPSTLQGTNMALAAANSAPGSLQMNQMIRPGKLVQGPKASAIASFTAATQSSSPPATTPAQAVNTQNNPLPPELMQDIATLRAINQYKSTASQNLPAGTKLDLVN